MRDWHPVSIISDTARGCGAHIPGGSAQTSSGAMSKTPQMPGCWSICVCNRGCFSCRGSVSNAPGQRSRNSQGKLDSGFAAAQANFRAIGIGSLLPLAGFRILVCGERCAVRSRYCLCARSAERERHNLVHGGKLRAFTWAHGWLFYPWPYLA